jgi:hypothetical protein
MKRNVLIFSMLALTVCATAQTKNVDIDSKGFHYSYRSFPSAPLDPMRFAYATSIAATNTTKKHVSTEELAKSLVVQGQTKTDNIDEASVLVELSLGDLIVSSSSVTERKVENKDKDGKVTSVYYLYAARVVYNFESSYRIKQGEKILKTGNPHSRIFEREYRSDEYKSRREAAEHWNNNRDVFIDRFHRSFAAEAVKFASEQATRLYGFEAIDARDVVKTTDEKKHNENAVFRAAVDSMAAAFAAMTPDVPMNRELANSLIKYFKSIPEKYADPKLKADIRLRYAAYFNLCKLYRHLDEPENAVQYADLLIANGYDPKDGEKLKKAALEQKAAFDKIGIRSSHFSPDAMFGKQKSAEAKEAPAEVEEQELSAGN